MAEDKHCVVCGKVRPAKAYKYCSRSCRNRVARHKLRQINGPVKTYESTCLNCGKFFVSASSSAKNCSKSCTRTRSSRRFAARYRALKKTDPIAAIRMMWPKRLITLRCRATARGLPCTVTFADLDWPEFCPILGVQLDYAAPCKGPKKANGWSIDRIDSAKGYVPGNIAIISYRANVIKSSGTAEEHRKIADWMDSITL